ncbi:MAG TPA: hypothetical protein VMU76_11560 [Acidimicrobiales bacterium]|nr:hypothetical protein [Acidimicrobiales bacterium]
MTPEELVATACPLFGSIGAAFYFDPATLSRGKELGLDGFRFYFLGRGGVLGDVEAPVVQSAFGYFAPGLVAKMWNSARAIVPPRQAGRAYVEESQRFGRANFDGVPGLDGFCTAAEAVRDAVDPAALALYAGLAAEPLAEDAPARAMQLATVLREFRGSAHLLAVVASGVPPRVAHYFRRPDDFTSFGYTEAEVPVLSEQDRSRIAAADALTDAVVLQAFGVLDEGGREALVQGAQRMAAKLG